MDPRFREDDGFWYIGKIGMVLGDTLEKRRLRYREDDGFWYIDENGIVLADTLKTVVPAKGGDPC